MRKPTISFRLVTRAVVACLLCAPVFFAASVHAQISADLWNGGGVRIGPSVTACGPSAKGLIRYDEAQSAMKFCDGGSWRALGATVSGGDNTPNVFSFTDLTDQPLSTLVYSSPATISGIDADVVVYVSGSGNPQISVNSGPWVAAGLISAGDMLQVRLISAGTISTARVAHVTVGTVSTDWTVTSRPAALKIFASVTTYTGAFGGVAAADAVCQNEAVTYGHAGIYKAAIADSTNSLSSRLTLSYPIVNLQGNVVFSTSMMNQAREENVMLANGANMVGYPFTVWMGVNAGGVTASNHCSNWSSTSGTGQEMSVWSGFGTLWPNSDVRPCSELNRLLCLQQ